MNINIETVKTTQNAKNILSKIKSKTGIQNWNIICRWAFCLSLKQDTPPRVIDEKLDGVEMTYETFAGKHSNIYLTLLINSLKKHKLEIHQLNLNKYLRAHINRGISILYNLKMKNISDMLILTSK
jgi:DNA sulfur modification protein DndE|tara:strand:+ start:4137 stop:4514 length:378 start_codon:yes stop_codon:yes gene_type:complete